MHSVRSFEMLDGGRFVTLCLTATRSLKIIQVDLKTGETQALSTTKLSNLFWLDSGPFAISGDLVAHSIRWRTPSSWSARFGGILLINWQEQTYVLISRPCPDVFSNLVPEVVLCPGHMIFTVEHQHATALVFAIADLTSHWRPISSLNFNDVVYWRSIVPAAVARFDDLRIADDREGPGVDTLKLMLYRSPLSHGGYKLFISHSDTLPDIPNWTMGFQKFPSALLAYRLTVSPATGVLEGWERTSAIHAGLPIHYGSYAGYVVERVPEGDAMNIVDLRHPTPGSAANRFIMETDGRFHAAAVSGYSHAVLQRRDSTLVVSYYI
ncbi:hypothetical protein B0H19DRAFT_605337 [Mycena capillaripes]|nr:hypothetical protein B0H19DRAFT_605337 [Mycena capillaripes]